MPITELNLYKSEWLELVFDDRNKSYGAYDLRKHYASNLFKALGFTTIGFVSLTLGYSLFLTHQPEPAMEKVVPVTLINPPVTKVKPVEPPKPKVEQPQVQTVKYVRMTPTDDDLAKNPPKIEDLQSAAISTVDQKGKIDPNANLGLSDAPSVKPETEEQPQPFGSVEVNPEYPGGESAWTKFLQKNLHYPSQAIESGIGGKVYISFVVEKDGHLTDFKILRSVGYGLDEEAIRVLKLVPPWKPGIQNGRPVRVMYTMPFNFQLPTDNN